MYQYTSFPLCPGGEEIELTLANARTYIDLTLNFCFHDGIRKQMEAFQGIILVVPNLDVPPPRNI